MSRIWTPREYQALARDFILDTQRCNLFAQPGLGKTSTTYAVFDHLKLLGSAFFPALVIAPKAVCELTWPAEQTKWSDFRDLRVVSLLGEPNVRENGLMTRGDVYVINYDNLQWLCKQLGERWPFKIVVADESTRLKSFRLRGKGGKRANAISYVAEKVGRWVNLSGTPAPNGLKDLWGQQWFVDYGAALGHSYSDFMRRWFFEDPYAKTVELRHPTCEAEIHAAMAPTTMALRAADWFDVLEPMVVPRYVELPPEARRVYDDMERDFFAEISGTDITAANAAVRSQKLLQMASGAVYDGDKVARLVHDAKIEALKSLVEELNGEPLLVTYWFQFEPVLLKKAIPDFHLFRGKKDQDEWNKGKIRVMGIHPQSGGHGIDLQHGGCKMAHLTHSWDLELLLQVRERIGPTRQLQSGYNRVVSYFNLIANRTMDEVVIERQDSKRGVLEALMAARAARAA
jgi:SNF2 family DNA or RNA helicase